MPHNLCHSNLHNNQAHCTGCRLEVGSPFGSPAMPASAASSARPTQDSLPDFTLTSPLPPGTTPNAAALHTPRATLSHQLSHLTHGLNPDSPTKSISFPHSLHAVGSGDALGTPSLLCPGAPPLALGRSASMAGMQDSAAAAAAAEALLAAHAARLREQDGEQIGIMVDRVLDILVAEVEADFLLGDDSDLSSDDDGFGSSDDE